MINQIVNNLFDIGRSLIIAFIMLEISVTVAMFIEEKFKGNIDKIIKKMHSLRINLIPIEIRANCSDIHNNKELFKVFTDSSLYIIIKKLENNIEISDKCVSLMVMCYKYLHANRVIRQLQMLKITKELSYNYDDYSTLRVYNYKDGMVNEIRDIPFKELKEEWNNRNIKIAKLMEV